MKTIILLLSLSFLVSTGICQNIPLSIKEKNLESSFARGYLKYLQAASTQKTVQYDISEKEYKLDSLVSENIYESDAFAGDDKTRTFYEYDTNENELKEQQEAWDGEEWVPESKLEMTYNGNGQKLTELYSYWSASENKWEDDYKTENTYSEDYDLSTSIYYESDGDNLEPSEKTDYYYQESIYPACNIMYEWEEEWVEYRKQEFKWNNNGQITEWIDLKYNSENQPWKENSKTEYNYDSSGNVTEVLIYSWDGQWIAISKAEYSYNANGNVILFQNFSRYADEDPWEKGLLHEYSYNDNGKLASFQRSSWDDGTEKYIGVLKESYTYDSENNLHEYFYSVYDESSGTWDNQSKSGYECNGSISVLNTLFPPGNESYYNQFFESTPATQTNYIYEDGTPVPYILRNYYYSKRTNVGVPDFSLNNLVIFPNPVSDVLHFRPSTSKTDFTIAIYNLNGKKLMEYPDLNGNTTIELNVSALAAGVYLCRIQNGSKSYNQKIIKK